MTADEHLHKHDHASSEQRYEIDGKQSSGNQSWRFVIGVPQLALLNPKTPILFQKHHPYTGK